MDITTWIENQTNDIWNAAVVVIGVVVAVVAFIKMIQSGFSIAKIVMITVTAALVIWLVQFDGLEFIAKMFSAQGRGQ